MRPFNMKQIAIMIFCVMLSATAIGAETVEELLESEHAKLCDTGDKLECVLMFKKLNEHPTKSEPLTRH